jgi:tRNA U55 pseudouridine synthase TruB
VIERLALVAHERDRSVLEADCGKGTYVRAIAAISAGRSAASATSRRSGAPASAPFAQEDAVTIADLQAPPDPEPTASCAVDAALGELASVAVSRDLAVRLMRGQPILLRGRDAPRSARSTRPAAACSSRWATSRRANSCPTACSTSAPGQPEPTPVGQGRPAPTVGLRPLCSSDMYLR